MVERVLDGITVQAVADPGEAEVVADPAVIQDVCFSCHGEMGERQLKFDTGPDAPRTPRYFHEREECGQA